MRMSGEAMGKAAAATLVLLVLAGALMVASWKDQRERDLLSSGTCTLVMEALYTPPPVGHTSCHGDQSRSCTTWYSQADPYLRKLWRCPDPEREGVEVEFWRRSAERRMW